MVRIYRSLLLFTLLVAFTLPASVSAQGLLKKISSYETGIFDDSATEIVTYDATTQRLFVTNSANTSIDVVDLSDPFNPTFVEAIDISVYGGSPTSVDAYDGTIAVAVPAATETDPGSVVFFNAADASFLGQATVGALPDMLTFTPDGSYVVTADEGQPSDDYSIDPEGSISLVNATTYDAMTIGFTDFNAGESREADLPSGVRIFGPNASVAQDLEPEYVTTDGTTVYAVMQENNALAVIDIATASVTAILDLGAKDHSIMGNGMDASNRDDAINIQTWPVQGFYMPDAIASYEVNGELFLVTANEGDARDYDTYSEEARVADLTLDPTAFPNAATLQDDANLGRLKTTLENGDTDGDGDFDVIYSYGARSFTIWSSAGVPVFDSGSMVEEYVAAFLPNDFNSTNDENDSFDNRSDDKGPEPEALAIGVVNGVPHAFLGLERVGGIMTFDISDPTNPTFVDYTNSRDFSVDFDPDTITSEELSAVGDLGPEGIEFIAAGDNALGVDLIAVANEVSGNVSVFVIGQVPNIASSLTVLHNNDGESQLLFAPGQEDFGGAARFKTLMDDLRSSAGGAVLTLSSGDNFLAGPEFQVSLDQPEGERLFESIALDLIGYDALAIGNHEFDFGPDVLERLITDFDSDTPFLSANLDFSNEPGLAALETAGRIAASTTVLKDGQLYGVVGATTPNLPFVSSPRNVIVMENIAELVQAEIDAFEAKGINKIILISHLQGIEEDQELIGMLTGVDIAIAGGGDELLANEDDLLVPGDDEIFDVYPIITQDMDGADVPVVTTSGNYKYIGRLIVDFDENGVITSISDESGPVRVSGIENDAVTEDADVVAQVTTPVEAAVAGLASNIIGSSEVALDGVRGNIRSIETNLGNLITDAYLWQAAQLAGDFGVDVPQVAFANGGGIRNDNVIPAGDISELTTFDILPFGNQLTVVQDIPATQFKELLENGVSAIGGSSGTGRFLQLGGMTLTYDPSATAQDTDDGVIVTPGERVRRVVLDDGRLIVNNGEVVDESVTIDVVTVNFTANGGDEFLFGEGPFTSLGVTYQKTLANYIEQGLGGVIASADYPEGGEGRIAEVQANAAIQLTVLHNNDGESQLLFAPGQEDFGGAARFKTLMDNLRDEADESGAVITLSSGDNFLAGPEFQVSLDQPEGERLFESIALNLIGYDALAIGNHEFDFGPDVLARLITDFPAPTPFLSANLDMSGEPALVALEEAGRIAKSAYFVKDGQLIGVVGATTPNLPFVSSPRNVVAMDNIAELVQAEISTLTGMGVNKIILISHLQGIEEDQELIGMLTDVDIVIAGGGDELLANEGDLLVPGDDEIFDAYPIIAQDMTGADVPVVTTAGNYKYIGRLVVDFDENGVITNIGDDSGPVRVSGIEDDAVEEDEEVLESVTNPVAAAVAGLASNVIGMSEVGLDGVRANIRGVETNLGNLITDAYLWQAEQLAGEFDVDVPQVAFANGGGIRNDNVIPAGEISELTTFDILPFGNQLTVVEDIPVAQFKELLENGVSAIGGSSGTGRFLQIAGLTLRYDPAETAQDTEDGAIVTPGTRVRTARLDDGTVLVDEGEIVVDESFTIDVVTVNFTANGGDEFIFGEGPFTSLGVTYQKTLANYIEEGLGGTISAAAYPEGGEGRILTTAEAVSVEDPIASELPLEYALNGNYPNPFNPTTTISFSLPETAEVQLAVYDMLGRQVMLLVNNQIAAGNHEIQFAADNLPSGTYFYRLTTPKGQFVKQMILLK